MSEADETHTARFWQLHLTDPFAVRGPHKVDGVWAVEAFLPGATAVDLITDFDPPLAMATTGDGRFSGIPASIPAYRLRIHWGDAIQETEDPYSFGPVLGDTDKYLFSEGSHWRLADRFGAVPMVHQGVAGVSFAVWAPNARRVSVIGDFNSWDGRRHPMRLLHGAGIWEIFIPRIGPGERYKYEIVAADGATLPAKADPVARAAEMPPATASVVAPILDHAWHDEDWQSQRAGKQTAEAPISIYELHVASWMRPDGTDSGTLTWAGLAQRLIPYVRGLGFTHIELMPIMEHPFSGSWGYQPLSQFAPSARFGSPQDFAAFVDACHQNDIGVLLDWVPAHFPNDAHGLAHFDGSPLYEHADPREGFHPDWNTCVYNLGRREVQGWLIASALWWCETFHVDGLRVDAVASMLYRDYSRKEGQWIPNRYGGRENLEAIDFLKRLNDVVKARCPGVITVAEESTAWPGVSAPVASGGLGFDFKWNMGWMHDTLLYVARDPIHRKWHHNDLTFGLLYAFSERFVLPLSHDEVVHGKGSLYGRVPGDPWRKLATLRAYFTFMWTHPGKKLLFMGGELAMPSEWNHDGSVDWRLLDDPGHKGVHDLIGALNRLYRSEPDLHHGDAREDGFRWIVGDDSENCVFAYCRGRGPIVAVVNMTPTPRFDYQIGVPHPGRWTEVLNSDSAHFGGSNMGNLGHLQTVADPQHGFEQSLRLTLPPLGALLLKLDISDA